MMVIGLVGKAVCALAGCDSQIDAAAIAADRIVRRLNRIGHSLQNCRLADSLAQRFRQATARRRPPQLPYDYTNIWYNLLLGHLLRPERIFRGISTFLPLAAARPTCFGPCGYISGFWSFLTGRRVGRRGPGCCGVKSLLFWIARLGNVWGMSLTAKTAF